MSDGRIPDEVAEWLRSRTNGDRLTVHRADRSLAVDFVDGALLLEE